MPGTRSPRATARATLLLLLIVWSGAAGAAVTFGGQTHDRVLQSAEADTAAGVTTLVLGLLLPAHYAWHFPRKPSGEVLIAVRLSENPRDAAGRPEYREHLAVPAQARDVVQEIGFESDGEHGNFIVLRFWATASVAVTPGASAHQLVITIRPSGGGKGND